MVVMILVLLSTIGVCAARAQSGPERLWGRWDDQFDRYRFEDDYETAEAHFRQMIDADPEHPFGYLSLATMCSVRLLDLPVIAHQDTFYELVDTAIEKSRTMAKEDSSSVEGEFLLGSSLASKAIYQGLTHEFIPAASTGRESVVALRKVLKKNRVIADAQYALGLFEYSGYKLPGYVKPLKWMLGWIWPGARMLGGDLDEAIRRLELSMNMGVLNRVESRAGLTMLYLEEAKTAEGDSRNAMYARATELAYDLTKEYPDSRYFLRLIGDALLQSGRASEALPYYENLLERVESDRSATPGNIVLHRLNIAKCELKLGRREEATLRLRSIVEDDHKPSERKLYFIKNYYASAKKLLGCIDSTLISGADLVSRCM